MTRPRTIPCPIPGCTTRGGREYMEARHNREQHCRCGCGWVGLTANHRRHIGQRRRLARELGIPYGPSGLHVISYPISPNHHEAPR